MRVAFLSEGATELGFPGGERSPEARIRNPLLRIIVERILDRQGAMEPLVDKRLPFLSSNPAGRLCKKAATLVRQCAKHGAEAAVIVVDRDRTPPCGRWRALVAQRQSLRTDPERPLALPVAIGVAVETIEAWLLADEVALCDVLGLPHPGQPMGSPETLDGKPGEATHPKSVLNSRFAQDTEQERAFLDRVVAVGERMDLDVVARRCPQGFGHFREDVLRELGPRLGVR